jgi:CAAX prenyl protease-like protein
MPDSAGATAAPPRRKCREGGGRALAHVLPFALFMGFLLVLQLFSAVFGWDHPAAPWWRRWPEQWIYPIQTLACLGVLLRFRRCYELRWSRWVPVAVLFGAAGIGIWLLPAAAYGWLGLAEEPNGWLKWLGVVARTEGFNPGVFTTPGAFWASLLLRFFRAVVVVALVEEIFWRAFLMRFLLKPDGDYWAVPFGKPAWMSYVVVSAAFVLAHPLDFALVAWIYASLAYALAVVSRSLLACVVMHATANLLMGLYIMETGKFGLW